MLLIGALLCPSVVHMTTASAASYSSLSNEEKAAFDKLYSASSTSTLQNVTVNYSTETAGQNNINSYHWTAWKKVAKGASITKSANSGKGVGSGSYNGFTQSKINSWKTDEKYINAIKSINNGKFPSDGNYTFPTDTSTSKLDWWVDEVGFYDIMSDPKYSKVTLKGYRTFNWTEKVKKTSVEEKYKNHYFITPGGASDGLSWDTDALKANLIANIETLDFNENTNQSVSSITNKIVSNITKSKITSGEFGGCEKGSGSITITNGNYKSTFSITIMPKKDYANTDATTGARFYEVALTKKTQVTTISYETVSHTKKQQIAQTIVAKNAYASEIQKYNNFYMVPKSSVSSNKIKTRSTGFWLNINPYYHNGSTSTIDEGNYSYTFSNQVTSGKSGTNVYAMLSEPYKFFTDFADTYISAPDVANPPLDSEDSNNNGGNNNNDNNGNNGNNGNDGNNNGNNNNEGNNGGNNNNDNNGNNNGNNNGGQSSIGDKSNQPMVNIEIDAKTDSSGAIGTVRLPKRVHLYDINKKQ